MRYEAPRTNWRNGPITNQRGKGVGKGQSAGDMSRVPVGSVRSGADVSGQQGRYKTRPRVSLLSIFK